MADAKIRARIVQRLSRPSMSCVTSRARVTGWGGAKAVFGTNASAFACPRAEGPPIVWDQAASVMSQGDVLRAAREGRPLPEGVGVDADGRPTTDASRVLDGGALVAFGGVKGAAILAGVLLMNYLAPVALLIGATRATA